MCTDFCTGRKYGSTPKQSIKKSVAANSTKVYDCPLLCVHSSECVYPAFTIVSSDDTTKAPVTHWLSSQPSVKTSGTF